MLAALNPALRARHRNGVLRRWCTHEQMHPEHARFGRFSAARLSELAIQVCESTIVAALVKESNNDRRESLSCHWIAHWDARDMTRAMPSLTTNIQGYVTLIFSASTCCWFMTISKSGNVSALTGCGITDNAMSGKVSGHTDHRFQAFFAHWDARDMTRAMPPLTTNIQGCGFMTISKPGNTVVILAHTCALCTWTCMQSTIIMKSNTCTLYQI